MSATAYGIGLQEFKAQPDFTARRDATGAWSASNSFSMLREVWENYAQAEFIKGAAITDLYTELTDYWSFLVLDQVEVSNQPGGITIARCEWVGFKPGEEDSDDPNETSDSQVYVLSGTRAEKSILTHPLYRKEVIEGTADANQRQAIVGAWNGNWVADTSQTNDKDTYYLQSTLDPSKIVIFTDPLVIKWVRCILEQGIKTFKSVAIQWTVETASVDGWKDVDLDHLGIVQFNEQNRPPGNPPMPRFGEYEWLKVSMNQTTTNGKTLQSQTWELVPPGGEHRFLAPYEDSGLYNYDPTELEGESS